MDSIPTLVIDASPPLPQGYARPQRRVAIDRSPAVDGAIIAACRDATRNLGGHKLTRLGVTSSVRGEGRTSVAAGLATVQAQDHGRSTLLLDADFDSPGVAGLFDLPPAPGIAEVLAGRAGIDRALHEVWEDLTVLTAGEVATVPSRLARDLVTSDVLAELQQAFDVIIADLPPLLDSTAGPHLAEAFAEPLLVVRARATPIAAVREAMATLPKEPPVLLNRTRSHVPGWLGRLVRT